MKRETLRTVEEMFAAFGGDAVVAEWLGVGRSAVSNWKVRGVPTHYHLLFWLEAQELGLRIDPKVFGVDAWPSIRTFHGRQQVA